MSKNSVVAVVRVGNSVQDATRQAMRLASWKTFVRKGEPTSLKVNLGWDLFIPGSITSPWVLEGVIQEIREWVGPLYLVEADQVMENIEKAYRKSRLERLCRQYDVRWINMSREATRSVPVQNGKIFHELVLPTILLETQLLTIPVMKTHAKSQITGAIKNQWGCISKLRHNYHLVLSDALADINATVRPVFCVMDATICLEANGPKSGRPKIVDRVLASPDLVALDTIQATMMGLDASGISHIRACAERGLGTNSLREIDVVGEEGAKTLNLHFEPAQHNLVSRIEELLRRSRWKWLFFDTPLFWIEVAGAKIWYFVWYYLVSGKKHWAAILRHPLYGPLWKSIVEDTE